MRQVFALTFLIIAMTASLAEAECAWVLWEQEIAGGRLSNGATIKPIETWRMQTPFGSREECGRLMEPVARNRAATLREEKPQAKVELMPAEHPIGVYYEAGGQSGVVAWVNYFFSCWPDSVDPSKKGRWVE